MKFLFAKRNIFILIYILLIKITYENELKQIKRIENSIDLIIFNAKGLIDNISLTFEYEKYNITLKNFNILKPFEKNISFINETSINNKNIFKKQNVLVTINSDLYVQLFSQKDNKQIKYKSIFFEIYFNKIKFELINDFNIEFISSNIETIIFNNLDNLNFFKEFNNKKKCIFYIGENTPIILEDIDYKLKEIFRAEFESKIIQNQKYFNLLTYDMIQIFDNFYFNIEPSPSKYSYITNIDVKKIKMDMKDIILNNENNTISIKYFSLQGSYYFMGILETFFNYTFACEKDDKHFIFKRNKNNTKIDLFLSDCNLFDDNLIMETYQIECFDEIKSIVQNNYINYISKSADEYYNNIFGL